MHNCTETQAVCRGCGLKLRGSPSWKSGFAYHPEPGGVVKTCHYGGWACYAVATSMHALSLKGPCLAVDRLPAISVCRSTPKKALNATGRRLHEQLDQVQRQAARRRS